MGCSISGLNALYDAATGGGDVWINERRFRVLRQIGEGGFAFVYLVKEHEASSETARGRHPSHVSGHHLIPIPTHLPASGDLSPQCFVCVTCSARSS
jgi:hypothetical protein